MGRKISFVISFVFIVLFFNMNIHSSAQEKNVNECLETNEDCLEEIAPTSIETEEDGKIIGENQTSTSFLFNLIKMIFALFLVLALIYFLLTFIKKRNTLFSQVNHLENLGGISVGQNKSIQLIRIGEKVYVIGVGDNVELLQEVTDTETKQALFDKADTTATPTSMFQQLFKKQTEITKEEDSYKSDKTFTSTLQDELHKLKNNRHRLIDRYREKDDA